MAVERYIDMIRSGNATLPLVLSRADVAKVVSARFNVRLSYEDLPGFADTNFLYFTPEKESIGVEEVRLLISKVHFATGGDIRIVVLDKFDTATDESANALLKTLEDGIPGVVFLLQVESFVGLLETIVSRVVCVSSDTTALTVRDADRELARGLVALRPESIKKYVGSRWNNRWEGLVFIEALQDVLMEKGIVWNIYERLTESYLAIANTNAQPKYVLDRLVLDLAKSVGK